MSGVPVRRVVTISHVLSGLLAAAAGMMVVARLGAAMPSVGGEDWLLPSFLGPVLGGTLLSGGSVAVVGTMLGALLVDHHPKRPPGAADRQFLAAALPRR